APPAKDSNRPEQFDEETSSSGESSDSKSKNAPRDENKPKRASKRPSEDISNSQIREAGQQKDTEDGIGTAQVRALSISRSSPTPPLESSSFKSSKELHPLEALFKRPTNAASQTPKKPSLEVRTSFNFFEPDADESSNTKLVIPQTPFTQQDYQRRRMRSAAPTPDTAAPGRATFGHVWSQGSDVPEEEDEYGEPGTDTPLESKNIKKEEEKQESEFQKWFWEHRGENNRAWKRRRREAAKEKRQRDNKKRSELLNSAISDMMASSPLPPLIPSTNPRTPRIKTNSWLRRSYPTLHPSDSPSQAKFPRRSRDPPLHQRQHALGHDGILDNARDCQRNRRAASSPRKRTGWLIVLVVLFHMGTILCTAAIVLACRSRNGRLHAGVVIAGIIGLSIALGSLLLLWEEAAKRKEKNELARKYDSENVSFEPSKRQQEEVTKDDKPGLSNKAYSDKFRRSTSKVQPLQTRNMGGNKGIEMTSIVLQRPPASYQAARRGTRNTGQQPASKDLAPVQQTPALLNSFLEAELHRQRAAHIRTTTWLQGIENRPPSEQLDIAVPVPTALADKGKGKSFDGGIQRHSSKVDEEKQTRLMREIENIIGKGIWSPEPLPHGSLEAGETSPVNSAAFLDSVPAPVPSPETALFAPQPHKAGPLQAGRGAPKVTKGNDKGNEAKPPPRSNPSPNQVKQHSVPISPSNAVHNAAITASPTGRRTGAMATSNYASPLRSHFSPTSPQCPMQALQNRLSGAVDSTVDKWLEGMKVRLSFPVKAGDDCGGLWKKRWPWWKSRARGS
ncbi:MAG: hypothetical protein Q9214_005909, partial [Letrouitia sp. 1 TL-2023]